MVGLLERSRKLGKSWWHVYLDNFAAGEIINEGELDHGGEVHHRATQHAWQSAGVVSSKKKRKAELQGQELGAMIDGETRIMGPFWR